MLTEGVHSGAASGIIPSTFRIARILLDRIEDSKTGEILIPEFHTEISEKRVQQAKQAAEALGDVVWSEFPYVENAQPITKDKAQLLLNKTWRPQLAVTGASGFPHAR
jgi:hypothetical protein